jgi:hypothetical protein
VYIRFDIRYTNELEDIKQEVKNWAERYGIRYTYKTIKYHHRVGFDHNEHFSLFAMTWNPKELELRPWLKYQLVNVVGEKY